MPPTPKHWFIHPQIPPAIDQALKTDNRLAKLHPVMRQIVANRGYLEPGSAYKFLAAAPPEITDPFLMRGMKAAVERILLAIEGKEVIAVYGDYDVDGVTATALLVETLEKVGAQARGHIPNRFDEGYGLNNEALDKLAQEGVTLVITVDCGVRSLPEAAHAREIGLALIITDHHQPAADLPDAYAIINPKQAGDDYPDKNLAGVGIAYKLASALIARAKEMDPALVIDPDSCLDMVALGTVADLAPLTGENRWLVRKGLGRIRASPRCGVFALSQAAGIDFKRVTAGDVGFVLGPRLNAAGRIDSAMDAYELLHTPDGERAAILAQNLDDRNRKRQDVTREIQERAEQKAMEADPDGWLMFAVDPGFNKGVIGLAASRLTESHYRPAIVATQDEQYTRASCRSIKEFHITEALDQCAELMEHHGGHAAAAGFTVRNENLEALIGRLKQIAEQILSPLELRQTLTAEAEVKLTDLSETLLKQMDYLQPTGYGNPAPLFVSRDVKRVAARPVGADGKHLKLTVEGDNLTFDAICFRQGGREVPARLDLIYALEENSYNGRQSLQLNVREFKAAGAAD